MKNTEGLVLTFTDNGCSWASGSLQHLPDRITITADGGHQTSLCLFNHVTVSKQKKKKCMHELLCHFHSKASEERLITCISIARRSKGRTMGYLFWAHSHVTFAFRGAITPASTIFFRPEQNAGAIAPRFGCRRTHCGRGAQPRCY